jgi:hypothetical protein
LFFEACKYSTSFFWRSVSSTGSYDCIKLAGSIVRSSFELVVGECAG